MTGPVARRLLAWFWVVLCIAAILSLSGDVFGAHTTSRILTPLLRWLDPDISARTLHSIHVAVRKSAHVTEYALLAVLAFRALRLTLDVSLLRHAALTLGLVAAVAGIDELRQTLVPMRTGSVTDVAIDFGGGAIGVALIVALHRWLGIGAPVTKGGA